MYCGHCHTCGTKLIALAEGGEYCPHCAAVRAYVWHGRGEDPSLCPSPEVSLRVRSLNADIDRSCYRLLYDVLRHPGPCDQATVDTLLHVKDLLQQAHLVIKYGVDHEHS
jgi:hypothetical protein